MVSSLTSHFCTFLFIFPIGLRRLFSFFNLYLKNTPTHFLAKPWYYSSSSSTYILFTNIDLYILLIGLPIASFFDLYLFLSILPHHFSFLHHQAILTFFWLLLLLILLSNHRPIPDGFIFAFAAISFLLELYLIDNGDTVFTNVTSYAYHLSCLLSLVCACSCMYLSVNPYSFFAEFALCGGLVFKGTWVMQIGLNLYTDMFAFKGCLKMNGKVGYVKCDLNEDSLRAIALIDLLFVCHAIVVLLGTFVLFALLSFKGTPSSDAAGPLLTVSQLEGSCKVEFEIE